MSCFVIKIVYFLFRKRNYCLYVFLSFFSFQVWEISVKNKLLTETRFVSVNPFTACYEHSSYLIKTVPVSQNKKNLFKVWYHCFQLEQADKVSQIKLISGIIGTVIKIVICRKSSNFGIFTLKEHFHTSERQLTIYNHKTYSI